MAIIVDKVQKRKDIALSCKDLFYKNGISDLTIAQVAKVAGVGKGTIYDYFKNKEDIVFEIVNILMQESNEEKQSQLNSVTSTREKVKIFSGIFYDDDKKSLRQLYKEFVSISLLNPEPEMLKFQTTCAQDYFGWFQRIMYEGVQSGELKAGSEVFARGLFAASEGMFIKKVSTLVTYSVKEEVYQFYDAIFDMIEVKND